MDQRVTQVSALTSGRRCLRSTFISPPQITILQTRTFAANRLRKDIEKQLHFAEKHIPARKCKKRWIHRWRPKWETPRVAKKGSATKKTDDSLSLSLSCRDVYKTTGRMIRRGHGRKRGGAREEQWPSYGKDEENKTNGQLRGRTVLLLLLRRLVVCRTYRRNIAFCGAAPLGQKVRGGKKKE